MVVSILLISVIFSALLIFDEYKQFEQESDGSVLSSSSDLAVLKTKLIKVIVEIATLSLIVFSFLVGISKIMDAMISRDIKLFFEFFESVHDKKSVLEVEKFYFSEFKKMATHANEMAETIFNQKESLQELNESLKERVKLKTQKLREQNEILNEQKEFTQELLASQKQFIRYAIHETHTPLAVIMANIELYALNNGKDRYLSKIEAATKNIFNIFDDLGYLMKKDQVIYPAKSIDMGEYIQMRVEFFDEVAHFSNMKLEFIAPPKEISIYFNETKLQRIVDNNITNAIRYTKPHEKIEIGLDSDEKYCYFWVSSKSEIIEDTDRVFEAFYRERRKIDGFGLGLNLVKSICDEENIEIEIVSNIHQTTFKYRFNREDIAA